MQLVTDLSALTRWIPLIMVCCYSQQMTQGFTRCSHMLMVKLIKSKCSTRQESVVLVILRPQTKVAVKTIRHRWETQCTMATSWKISDKAMLGNKMWIISKHSSIMEDSHSNKWTIRTSPTQVTEMELVPSVSTLLELEATELVLPTVWPKIIKLICSIWSTKGKHQMVIRTTTNNKWWWQLSNSSTQHQTTTKWSQAWTHQGRTLLRPTLISRRLPRQNSVSRDKTVELLTPPSTRTACLFKEMVTIIIWMLLSTSITTERDQSKEVLVTSPMWTQWMQPWTLATSLEAMVVIATLPAVITQP